MISSILLAIVLFGFVIILATVACVRFDEEKFISGTIMSVIAFVVLVVMFIALYAMAQGDLQREYIKKIPTLQSQLAQYDLDQARIKVEELEKQFTE